MNGYVSKQNYRIWDDTNPREIHQMHYEKVTVWCGFWSGRIISPYFFQNEAGVVITINSERYKSMISNFLWPKMDDMDTDNRTLRATHRMPRWTFCTRDLRAWLSRAAANWPLRSCDLTLDFFLWEGSSFFLLILNRKSIQINCKQLMLSKSTNAIQQIQPDLCEKVIENWTARIRLTKRSRGGHLSDVIFHT